MATSAADIDERMERIHAAIAAEVRAAAARAGVQHSALARAVGIAPQSMSSRLRGHQAFRDAELVIIADALGCDVASFFARPPSLTGRYAAHARPRSAYCLAA